MNFLPGPAWLLLNKTGPHFSPSLYIPSTLSLSLSHGSLSPPAEVDVGDGGHAVRLEEPLHAAEWQFCGKKDP